jgi:carboxyl-terminal processing protease
MKFSKPLIKRIALIGAPIIGAAIIAAGSFYFGYQRGIEQPKTIIIENVTNLDDGRKIETNFGVFWEAWDLIKKEYIKGAETVDKNLIYGAIQGLVNSLEDPNTIFLPPDDSKKFEEDVTGSFGGIGAEIGIKKNQLMVIAPLKNTPAEKAGLKAGDKILAINNENTQGIDVNQAVKKIRGDIGTEVTLTILREGWEKPEDFKIIRANIEIPTLEWNLIVKEDGQKIVSEKDENWLLKKDGKEIAHIKLFSFNQNAPIAFYKAALRMLVGKTDGLILDLRNNPGGFLEVAVNLAGWFLNKGDIIVTEKFKNENEIIFRANGNEALIDLPTVVLINEGSASASEILAGALRANRGVKLIGMKTFGKGTVQELQSLSDGSKIKLTIANWILSDGTIIEEQGLKPDFEVELKEEDLENKKDPQLEKAIEVILEALKGGS